MVSTPKWDRRVTHIRQPTLLTFGDHVHAADTERMPGNEFPAGPTDAHATVPIIQAFFHTLGEFLDDVQTHRFKK